MLNFDDSDQSVLAFYNVSTLQPQSLQDLNIPSKESFSIDVDELEKLSTDDQFNMLNDIVNASTHSLDDPNFDFTEEDHHDPLSRSRRNVVQDLLQKNVIKSPNDPYLKKFLISSQNFDSLTFLSTVHEDSTIDELNFSLQYLEKNIESQTSELKSVINENFLNFINCKRAIDEVLVGFKAQKSFAQQERDKSKVFNPQRNVSRSLTKSESLSSNLEESIQNLNMASSLLIRPIMEHNEKEIKLNKLIDFISKNRFFFDLPGNLILHILKYDHNLFIADYNRYLKEKRQITAFQEEKYTREIAQLDKEKDKDLIANLKLEQTISNSALSKIFNKVHLIINEYRKKIYKELLSMDHEAGLTNGSYTSTAKNVSDSKFISLVDRLYELDDQSKISNPLYEFLSAQLASLKKDLEYQTNKFNAKFTMMQRKLLDYVNSLADHREGGSYIRHIAEKYHNIEEIFRASSTTVTTPSNEERQKIIIETFGSSDSLDLSIISETWLVLTNYINYMDDLFLKSVAKFVNNYLHYADPNGKFNIDTNGKLRESFVKIIVDASQKLVKIFNNNEVVDQMTSSPDNYNHFLPYHTNSLSTIFYLTDISTKVNHWLTKIGMSVVVVGNTSKSLDTNKIIKALRDYSGVIDQKVLEAICSSWVNDCSQFYDIENWERHSDEHTKFTERGEPTEPIHTKAMKILEYYETYVLTKLSDLLLNRKVNLGEESEESIRVIAAFPSKRILVSLEIQFMRSMNVLIDSIMKKYNLEKQRSLYLASSNPKQVDINNNIENDLYKVLTMNNFDVLSKAIFPRLIHKFDILFTKNLLDQNLKLYVDIDKAVLTILDDILVKEKEWIQDKILKHFAKISLQSTLPNNKLELRIDGFIYEILIHFVKLIHIVKPLTGIEIFVTVINDLQTFFLNTFLSESRAIKENENYYDYGNLRLDISFFTEVFEPSEAFRLNDYCMSLVDIIHKSINENETNPQYTQTDLDRILTKSLKQSESEFVFSE